MSDAKQKKVIVAVIAAVAVVAVLAGGYFMLISPKQAKAAQLQSAAADTQNKLTVALAAARQPAGGTTNDASDLFRLSKAMPDSADTAGAILDLVAAAKATGVTIDGLNEPSDPTPATNGGTELTLAVIATLHGRYGQLTNFLGRIRRLVAVSNGTVDAHGRLFGVDSIGLVADPPNTSTLKATVNFEMYVYPVTATASTASTPTTTTPATSSDLSAAGASN